MSFVTALKPFNTITTAARSVAQLATDNEHLASWPAQMTASELDTKFKYAIVTMKTGATAWIQGVTGDGRLTFGRVNPSLFAALRSAPRASSAPRFFFYGAAPAPT